MDESERQKYRRIRDTLGPLLCELNGVFTDMRFESDYTEKIRIYEEDREELKKLTFRALIFFING